MTETRRGALFALSAFVWWGLAPIYFKLLVAVPPAMILTHRVLWSVLLVGLLLAAVGRARSALAVLATPAIMKRLVASGALIGVNWLIFLWAVNGGHALQASLGYFINPLVNVALGMIVLRERLTPLQGLAIAVAALGVGVMVVLGGSFPWVALSLAFSFGLYGLIRKVTPVDPTVGLLVETLLVSPFALLYVAWAVSTGTAAPFGDGSTETVMLLAGTSIITVIPLIAFAAGARRLPYATVGILQYVAPTLQFLVAVLLFGETFTEAHAVTFGLIWLGLALYTGDMLRRAARPAASQAPTGR